MSTKESKGSLKRDFYEFQDKVARLEGAKRELKILDTRGFEKEVSVIKSLLKNPDGVNEVNTLMAELRRKIFGRTKSEIHHHRVKHNIKHHHPKDHKNNHINNKKDKKVGIFVDNEFQRFLNSLKIDLSEELKDERAELHKKMSAELKIRKKALDKRYKEMKQNLQDVYKDKLKNGLDKEIEDRFNDELQKKWNKEKEKLDNIYKRRIKKMHKKYIREFKKRKKKIEARAKNLILGKTKT